MGWGFLGARLNRMAGFQATPVIESAAFNFFAPEGVKEKPAP